MGVLVISIIEVISHRPGCMMLGPADTPAHRVAEIMAVKMRLIMRLAPGGGSPGGIVVTSVVDRLFQAMVLFVLAGFGPGCQAVGCALCKVP
jgi:hypothetical protein